MKTHPRLTHYPHHKYYLEMEPGEFRPFVMFVNPPLFRSPHVNTDNLGLREQYDHDGQLIDITSCSYRECNVFIGASTAFGVDATSDKSTISSYLNIQDIPCINLSVRGATSQQELILFLMFNRYLPPVRNIILFSGINNVALSAMEDTVFYPEFGGLFCEDQQFERFSNQYALFGASRRTFDRKMFERAAGDLFARHRALRMLYRLFGGRKSEPQLPEKASLDFDEKFDLMANVLVNDINTWSQLRPSPRYRLHYVLQPVITWTNKPLTSTESACFHADLEMIDSMNIYTKYTVYQQYSSAIERACRAAGVAFYDANQWLNDPEYAHMDLFTDVCHMTDDGYALMADLIKQHIDLRE